MTDKKLPPIPDYPQAGKAPAMIESVTTIADLVGDGIPGLGYAKGLLVDRYVQGPLERKRAEFHARIADGLADLEKTLEGFDPSDLENNEEFIAAVFAATQAAMRSVSEEKREALCNTVLNMAAGLKLDEVLQGSFTSYAESFSGLHIQVLRIFDNPASLRSMIGANSTMMGPIKSYIAKMLVPGAASDEALDRVFSDLDTAGMTATSYSLILEPGAQQNSLLKPAGKAFLKFISAPIP